MTVKQFIACVFALIIARGAQAQTYPDKPIRMLVVASAGGGTDIIARTVAHALSTGLGQNVVLDNRPGAGGIIAADITAKSRPDGYTILMANTPLLMAPSMNAHLPFDLVHDFAAVSTVAATRSVLAVHPSVPVKSLKELIELAKAQPGRLNYSAGTLGSSAHFGTEQLKMMAGINLVRVPYKGTAESLSALIAGEVQLGFITLPAAMPYMSSGRLRIIAIGSLTRSPKLPDVPAISETLPGFEVPSGLGVLAPAHTPAAIIKRLNTEIVRLTDDAALRESALNQGMELAGSTSGEYAERIKTQIEQFSKVVQATGMRPN